METKIFKNESAKKRLNEWYQRFLDRAGVQSESIEVSTSYGKNHVLTIGDSSNTPLVCLHSMLTSSAHLASELALLSDEFYIIAPDLPGQSVKGLPIRLSYKDHSHARWLKEILDGLNLQNVHLLGVSLGDSFNDFTSNLKIPPLASDEELKRLTMPYLIIGAENDISFPGKDVITRSENQILNIETELIKNSKHSPPTTPEFRSWLDIRVKKFILN